MTGRLTEGSEFAGYQIERLVARGGMGLVYRAVRLDFTHQAVALKVVAPELADDESFRARFKREAGLAASISHPNVLPVHEAREHGGVLFLAMRWVEGRDLHQVLADDGPLGAERAARVVAGVAAALDAAHAQGLVHRDVKPANVLIETATDHVYLTDFGIAKSRDLTNLTGSLAVGTLNYMAPEQWEGKLDPRSDIYALGCVLFQALTNEPPFRFETPAAVMRAHMEAKPPAVSGRTPPVAAAFDPVIAKALAKKPERRYPSAGELGHAAMVAAAQPAPVPRQRRRRRGAPAEAAPADPAAERRPDSPPSDDAAAPTQPATDLTPATDPAPSAEPGRDDPTRRSRQWAAPPTPTPERSTAVTAPARPPNRGRWIGAGLALLVIAVVVVFAVTSRDPTPLPPTPIPTVVARTTPSPTAAPATPTPTAATPTSTSTSGDCTTCPTDAAVNAALDAYVQGYNRHDWNAASTAFLGSTVQEDDAGTYDDGASLHDHYTNDLWGRSGDTSLTMQPSDIKTYGHGKVVTDRPYTCRGACRTLHARGSVIVDLQQGASGDDAGIIRLDFVSFCDAQDASSVFIDGDRSKCKPKLP